MFEASFPLCVVCNKEVNFHQHALCCDKCCRWQHRLCDSGVTYKDYRFLTHGEIEMAWKCSDCSFENVEREPSPNLTKDHSRRSKRGVKLRKDPDFLYEKENLNPIINRNLDRVELTDLPPGWEKKPKRKFAGPNTKQDMNYISPNGRIFHCKEQALEFCKLHYQEVTNRNLEQLADPSSSITNHPDNNKQDSKINLADLTDKSFQPFIRLHKLDSNFDNIRMFQPFVQLQRLLPSEILRETKDTKRHHQLSRNSDSVSVSTEIAVNDTVIQSDKAKTNITNISVNDDNNNKIKKVKKKKTKLQRLEFKRHMKNNIKQLQIKEGKSPMKVKAQMKKDYLKINIRIDRKSLQIHPNHNLWIDNDQIPSERRRNLKLGSVKIKNEDLLEKKYILDNKQSSSGSSESEIVVENQVNEPHIVKPSAENAKAHKSDGSRLIWLHISPKDLKFGLIS